MVSCVANGARLFQIVLESFAAIVLLIEFIVFAVRSLCTLLLSILHCFSVVLDRSEVV